MYVSKGPSHKQEGQLHFDFGKRICLQVNSAMFDHKHRHLISYRGPTKRVILISIVFFVHPTYRLFESAHELT